MFYTTKNSMTGGTFHTVHERKSNVVSGMINDPSISGTNKVLSVDDEKRKAGAIY